MQEVVQAVGIQHIILETDSPFLSPVPHRGKRNEPSYIPLIAERVAELCGLNTAEVAEATTRNALEIFNLSGKI
jgi:TatD DNase family protein